MMNHKFKTSVENVCPAILLTLASYMTIVYVSARMWVAMALLPQLGYIPYICTLMKAVI